MVLPGKRRTLSLLRSGRLVAGAKSPGYELRRWHRCTVTREDDRFSLGIDGERVYVYHDPIPLTGGFVGISGRSAGLRIRNLRVSTLGTSATVSCLAVPDAFFNRQLYEQARSEYERIAASHPGRNEGRLAAFRSGLCVLEMAREEADSDMRSFLLEEANEVFANVTEANDCCLSALGGAMVASAGGNRTEKYKALAAALNDYPGDPQMSAVREWLLGRLHDAGRDHRQTVAEILPLAITHCMEDYWGRRVVRDLVKEALCLGTSWRR